MSTPEIEITIIGSTENIMKAGKIATIIKKVKEETKAYPHVKIKIICG